MPVNGDLGGRGRTVGITERMESVARPDGLMLSAATSGYR
jgi:class 3 adenylate cyclase